MEAQIVLGQKHSGDAPEDIALVVLHPGELRRGKARKVDIAGDRSEAGIGVEDGCLGTAAGVVPQHARPQHLSRRVEQRRAVHLAGKADAAHCGQFPRVRGSQLANSLFGGREPVGRVLLRPAVLRARYIKRRRRRDNYLLPLAD